MLGFDIAMEICYPFRLQLLLARFGNVTLDSIYSNTGRLELLFLNLTRDRESPVPIQMFQNSQKFSFYAAYSS
ncbi:hypothetical protein BDN70DRAFT_249263 [Pholiota conissans]|uniref:Uncharacterized protein n=1 Tax=Pholiota conissans TaxID=109636 RepID=A0A9P6CQV3_9AGAR|nr:hypothetical protein BDN70DRAFT_249263 [Pholiota conissans]